VLQGRCMRLARLLPGDSSFWHQGCFSIAEAAWIRLNYLLGKGFATIPACFCKVGKRSGMESEHSKGPNLPVDGRCSGKKSAGWRTIKC
ncbi:MAG: hypothetical protein LIP23_03090, partial [Planctomycetes bacterium]|nr:hypothetical protein [Planctomycetota bacterium]